MIARAVRGLNRAMGIDPMVRKELFGVSRRWQTYAGRTFYVSVLAIVLIVAWNEFSNWNMVSYSQVSRFGRELFYAFSIAQVILISLAAVGGAADMISKETRWGTLGLLKITPLSSWRITWGKWKAVMAHVLMLMLAGLPILGIGIYLGGASSFELLGIFVLTLTAGGFCAAVAILFSSFCRSAARPLVGSILALAGYCLFPILILAMFDPYIRDSEYLNSWAFVHPAYTLGMMVDGGMRGRSLFSTGAPWSTCSIVSTGFTFGLLGLASWRVSAIRSREHRTPLIRRFFLALDRLFERGPFAVKLWRDRTEVWDSNPFLWKEMHFRITGRLRWYIRIVVATMVVIGVMTIISLESRSWLDDVPMVGYAIVMGLFFLSCVSAGSSAFTSEKEEQKWGILMTTPMQPGKILLAKFLGAVTSTLTLVVVLAFLLGFAAFIGDVNLLYLTPIFGSTLIYGFYIISAGILISLALPSTRKSYMATLFAALFFLIILPIGAAILISLSGFRLSGDLTFVIEINPFYHLGALERLRWRGTSGFGNYWEAFFKTAFVYVGISVGLIAATKVNFDILARRNL